VVGPYNLTKAEEAIGQVGQKTCLLTAITLTLFGFGQIIRTNHQKAGSSEVICENEAWTLFTFSFGKLTEASVNEPAFWWLDLVRQQVFLSDKLVKRPAF
jgi:hypothetical protein